MKRFILPLLLLLGLAQPAHAQFSRIISIQLENNNGSIAQSFQSNFTLKVGANCTWSVTGTVATMNCSGGGGGSPASPTGSVQSNAGGGMFGAINILSAGGSDCDGFGSPCALTFDPSTFGYIFFGTDSMGSMGNMFDFFYDGGWELDSNDGTYNAQLFVGPGSGDTSLATQGPLGTTGLKLESDNRLLSIGRIQFNTSQFATNVTGTNFTAGAGWGDTPTIIGSGSDNNWFFHVMAGGAGIAMNPQFTFTYADGDMSAGSSAVLYTCSQSGGDDIIADVTTVTRNQTNEIFQWNGLPVTGKTYEITCFGAASN